MASTYSTNLALELIGTGEQSGTWGNTTNTNLGTLLEQAISGYVTQACTGGTDTLTIPNGASGVARNMYIELTGTGGGTVVVPANKKLYLIYNNCSSGAVTVKVSGQTGVSVPNAQKMFLVSNGTDVVNAVNYFATLGAGATTLASLTLTSPLAVTSGGTGSATVTANNVIVGNSGGTGFSSVAPSTSGNVLTSNGTAWTSSPAFVSGMIMMWSGSIASIPSGWLLCNGTSGTPDLRSRMVIGADSSGTYTVGATGGAATTTISASNLPSHTHTYSSTSGNASADHTHSFSATTGTESATHSHTDSGHTHTIASATTPGAPGVNNSTGGSTGVYITETGSGTANLGTESATHTHSVSGTSGGMSATHTHSVSGTTDATGSGTAATTISPYYALAYIMKS